MDRGGGELKVLLLRCYFKLYKTKITPVGERDIRIEIRTWYLSHQILLSYRGIRLAYKIQLNAGLLSQEEEMNSVAEIPSDVLSAPFHRGAD